MKHEITLDLLEEIAFVIVDTGSNRDEAAQYAKDALLENYTPVTIEIKPGVWCDDIDLAIDVLRTWDALFDLNFGFHCDLHVSNAVKEYALEGKIGICTSTGKVIISNDASYFTTQVSYLDIIAAANAMEG